ncbi:MAG TPA: type II CAAX endopeptidase family protein [Anaerolineaceae bacterium]|nr:type II CAAX endopeptidase family protein [Anaerolineaceae bacterium]
MRQHPLFSFFFMAYAFTWIIFIPYVLSEWSILPKASFYNLFYILHTFGPAVSAYIMFRITEGKAGWLGVRNRIKQVRAGWVWYVFILLGIPALILFGILVLPGALSSFQGLPQFFLVRYPFLFILIFFGGGPLGEEIGWRGFALPRMQSRYGALRATLLLGVLWTFWHLEDFLTASQGGGPGTGLSAFYFNLPIFFLQVMALAIIMTWVFNHTQGSIFIAILLHASYDTFGSTVQPLFSAPIVSRTNLAFVIGFALLAILVIILTGSRLGYQPNQEQPLSSG